MNPSCGSLFWNPSESLRPFPPLRAVLGEEPGGPGAAKGDRTRAAGALRQSFESALEPSCMRVPRDPLRPEEGLAPSLSLGRVSQTHPDPGTLWWPGQGIQFRSG